MYHVPLCLISQLPLCYHGGAEYRIYFFVIALCAREAPYESVLPLCRGFFQTKQRLLCTIFSIARCVSEAVSLFNFSLSFPQPRDITPTLTTPISHIYQLYSYQKSGSLHKGRRKGVFFFFSPCLHCSVPWSPSPSPQASLRTFCRSELVAEPAPLSP